MAHAKIKDHYSTLGVSRTASQEEIKVKFRSMVLKYHPDVNKTDEAKAIFMNIQEAFDALSDEHSRLLYDEELRAANAPDFRGDPWPSKRNKYNRQPQGATRATTGRAAGVHDSKPMYNIAEWERMHYGIGNPPSQSRKDGGFWPTGEKDEHLNDHQLYFKYRAERQRKGGYFWSTKKYSTLSFVRVLRHCA